MKEAEEAYRELYKKEAKKKLIIEYNSRLKKFNAKAESNANTIRFVLSKDYMELGPEIRKGAIQYLMSKFHKADETLEMSLYHKFMKNLGEYQGEGEAEDEELKESFERINNKYFFGSMSLPRIKWGVKSQRQLGSYSFSDDTIKISSILKGTGEALDYVMYHEMLHKKHKYQHKNGRSRSHTKEFRQDEKKFITKNGEDPETMLKRALKRRPKKSIRKKENERSITQQVLRAFLGGH